MPSIPSNIQFKPLSYTQLIEKGYLIPTDDYNYIFVEDVNLCLDNDAITPMVKNTIPYEQNTRTPTSNSLAQILQDNTDSTLDNYADANHAAVAANEQTNEQPVKDKSKQFKNISLICSS